MLTQFDFELYPDDCEVVEIPLHNQCVFLIQKNGTSSLRKDIKNQQLRVFKNQEIRQLSSVDVYIREPIQRYVSGINTYVQHLQRDYPQLDQATCIWFATNYKFLNRHYLPQFLWLVNLSRFLSPTCKITLRKLQDISKITEHNSHAGINPPTNIFNKIIKNSDNSDLQLWLFIDQMLEDMCDNTFTFNEIIETLKSHPSKSYQILTSRFVEIAKKITLS